MRYFLAVIASLLLASEVTAEETTNFDIKLVECANEAGMKIDDLQTSITNKDSKVGCVVACAMKKIGMMADGKLNKDVIVSIMENEKDSIPNYDKMKESLLQCFDEATSGGDLPECDLAGKFAYCMHSKDN